MAEHDRQTARPAYVTAIASRNSGRGPTQSSDWDRHAEHREACQLARGPRQMVPYEEQNLAPTILPQAREVGKILQSPFVLANVLTGRSYPVLPRVASVVGAGQRREAGAQRWPATWLTFVRSLLSNTQSVRVCCYLQCLPGL